ncbi:uncharacterized protein JCM6883_000308 [Sporobolomyces salmoneus]|uniref:uncharacterized protein n=1 Tax=Sporobolomyces salmoneus TaxID=183962 RepID=UPI003178940A
MAPPHNHVQDVLLALSLLALFSLPLAYLFPSTFSSFFQLFVSLWRTILYLLITLLVLLFVGGIALVGEKAYKRFSGKGKRIDDGGRIGSVTEGATEEEMRRAKRVNRETRMEQAAEKVVDKLEATGVGRLFQRKSRTVTSTTSRKGKEKAVNQDEGFELRELGVSSGVSRAPPPLPSR